jgi:uncharacterized membrane protein YcaP (DUF421 family)
MDFSSAMRELLFEKGSDLGLGTVALRAVVIFIVAIVYVRLARKRFIAQATAMDLVMAVIFGSTLSRGINGGSSLVSCLEAGIGIVILQRIFAHFSYRYRWFGSLVKGNSNVLISDGQLDRKEMEKHDLSDNDLRQELRLHANTEDLEDIKLAVLERSGQISFVKK